MHNMHASMHKLLFLLGVHPHGCQLLMSCTRIYVEKACA